MGILNFNSHNSNPKSGNQFSGFGVAGMVALALLSGCRQRDIRVTDVRVPQATTAAVQAEIRAAIGAIDGVDAAGAVFSNGVMTVHYDSMKLGIKNIEHAIKDIGYDANDFKGEPRKAK